MMGWAQREAPTLRSTRCCRSRPSAYRWLRSLWSNCSSRRARCVMGKPRDGRSTGNPWTVSATILETSPENAEVAIPGCDLGVQDQQCSGDRLCYAPPTTSFGRSTRWRRCRLISTILRELGLKFLKFLYQSIQRVAVRSLPAARGAVSCPAHHEALGFQSCNMALDRSRIFAHPIRQCVFGRTCILVGIPPMGCDLEHDVELVWLQAKFSLVPRTA